MTFKVGDKVKCLRSFSFTPCNGTIISIDDHGHASIDIASKPRRGGWTFLKEEFTNIGGEMSKYEDLKQRIEALENGWDKEADDILQEIEADEKFCYPTIEVGIRSSADHGGGRIRITDNRRDSNNPLKEFEYHSQGEKMEAFKEAFLWLLDNSDIPKVDKEKERKIDKIQKAIHTLQDELNELKEEK